MKHADNKCPKTDTQRPNCRAGTPKWENKSVEMQRATNHIGLREKMHFGSLKIKETERHTLPLKQHPEYQWAVKIVKEREQQRVARSKPQTGRAESKPILIIVVSMGWLVNEFVVAQVVAMERISRRLLLAKSWSVSDDPPKVDT